MTSWSLGGRNGESESLTNILDSETTLGSEMQEFLSPTSQSYSTYRLTVRSAEQGNTGLTISFPDIYQDFLWSGTSGSVIENYNL